MDYLINCVDRSTASIQDLSDSIGLVTKINGIVSLDWIECFDRRSRFDTFYPNQPIHLESTQSIYSSYPDSILLWINQRNG